MRRNRLRIRTSGFSSERLQIYTSVVRSFLCSAILDFRSYAFGSQAIPCLMCTLRSEGLVLSSNTAEPRPRSHNSTSSVPRSLAYPYTPSSLLLLMIVLNPDLRSVYLHDGPTLTKQHQPVLVRFPHKPLPAITYLLLVILLLPRTKDLRCSWLRSRLSPSRITYPSYRCIST